MWYAARLSSLSFFCSTSRYNQYYPTLLVSITTQPLQRHSTTTVHDYLLLSFITYESMNEKVAEDARAACLSLSRERARVGSTL
jgi:hypothetical protein